MKALVLAGGRGTRLRPITNTLNKHLIPIAGRPMIFRVLDDIAACGITDVIVNINQGDREIPKAVGDGSAWGLDIRYIEQPEPNGMMAPILLAEPLIGNAPFVLFGGDNILSGGIARHCGTFLSSDAAAHVLVTRVEHPERFGVAVVEHGRVIKTVEKPETFVSDLAVTAVYFYRPDIFEAMRHVRPEVRGNSGKPEYYPPPAHQWLIDHGRIVTVGEVTGWWKDTGTPEALLEGNSLILHGINREVHGDIHPAAVIQGRVRIGKGTVIGHDVVIRGPVVIGENAKIDASYIGPYTSIGDGVLFRNAEIEHSIVMDGVTMDTGERIVDSVLGKNCEIRSKKQTRPSGHTLIIGENTRVEL